MSDMQPALLTRIDSVTQELLGKKLRLAGEVLAYDATTALVILRARARDGGEGWAGVLVDVSDCVSQWSKPWLRERFCKVTTVGYLERAADTRLPEMPPHVRLPGVLDCGLVVRALLVSSARDLTMETWDEAIG
ncbi:hypothetical protein FB45DRAFT_1100144 [Roridomyces roridus]|uniref:Uncharacterized protein n=1 Tax=Roridomyces roridus TaxID=1738132 RepID=A0AAD7CH84_9AGAR|nr:hypothetical protein FB45DRAFT_1100144 [Roridomyces roridus]